MISPGNDRSCKEPDLFTPNCTFTTLPALLREAPDREKNTFWRRTVSSTYHEKRVLSLWYHCHQEALINFIYRCPWLNTQSFAHLCPAHKKVHVFSQKISTVLLRTPYATDTSLNPSAIGPPWILSLTMPKSHSCTHIYTYMYMYTHHKHVDIILVTCPVSNYQGLSVA